jgi:Zn-dependent protease with chaperone function
VNFFDAQDNARRVTRWLIVVFAVATVLIVAGVTLIVGASAYMLGDGQIGMNPSVLAVTAIVTALFIFGATAYKTAHLSRGGGQVAVDMGGTQVEPDVNDPLRRRLRNVVEEMAIASGLPVPDIYVLEREPGINAFAAGFAPGDAAIAVTRGTLESLGRDELQGVIAHEFSHILNGDMRLNIRLMGVLFGIMVLGLVGRLILRGSHRTGMVSSRRGRGQPAALLVGLGLTVIGWIGVLLARIIKAAVSRQREFLADASAVQFTRQTDGIANALKKIGGYSAHSFFRSVDPEEVSHMLFARGTARLTSLFATHPPLIERIRALDPSFREGDYPRQDFHRQQDGEASGQATSLVPEITAAIAAGGVAGIDGSISDAIGDPRPQHVEFAQRLRQSVPSDLYDAAHSRELSLLLVVALGMHREPAVVGRQLRVVKDMLGEDRAALVSRFHRQLLDIGPAYRLPLLEIAFPMLKLRPLPQLEFLQQLVLRVIDTDGEIDLGEFCYYRIVASQLGQALAPGGRKRGRHVSRTVLRESALRLIGILAEQGNDDPAAVELAYAAGIAEFGNWAGNTTANSRQTSTVAVLDRCLDALQSLNNRGRAKLIEAVSRCISHDGRLNLAEAELLRAVCASLDCPLPPLLAATPVGGTIVSPAVN